MSKFECESEGCGLDCCSGKKKWPELLGARADVAKATIETENEHVKAIVVLEGEYVVSNFCCNRVWVWVNSLDNGTVTRIPAIG